MYFVGIDISKFKHDCAIVDELGDVITPSWSFQNDREGFSLLKELLDALDGKKKIGLEATGHYGQNLKLFLENNDFSFMEFNPLLINRFVHSKSLRKTKTDSIDALMIAQYLMTVEYKPYPPSFYTFEKLKSLTRFRDSLIRQRSRQLVELTNILDKVFPEFKPFFKGRFSATALYKSIQTAFLCRNGAWIFSIRHFRKHWKDGKARFFPFALCHDELCADSD